MVDAAEADIVRPTVAADRPNRLLRQVFLILEDILDIRGLLTLLELRDQRARNRAGLFTLFPVVQICSDGVNRNPCVLQVLHADEQFFSNRVLRMEETVSKLGVILEQRVFPSRAKAALIAAIRQDGCAAAVSGRTAGRVANIHMVSHKLADQLDIGGLRAARTSCGELEVGLCKLDGLDALVADDVLFHVGLIHGDLVEVLLFRLHFVKRGHNQGVLRWAHSQAHAAA